MAPGVGNRGKGRPKGAKNKIPLQLRDMILQALEEAGGVEYLRGQALSKNPAAFLALIGRVLPLQVTGKDDRELSVTVNHNIRP